jgi:hypothetical protein
VARRHCRRAGNACSFERAGALWRAEPMDLLPLAFLLLGVLLLAIEERRSRPRSPTHLPRAAPPPSATSLRQRPARRRHRA